MIPAMFIREDVEAFTSPQAVFEKLSEVKTRMRFVEQDSSRELWQIVAISVRIVLE